MFSKLPIIEGAGLYTFDYAVLARQFPILSFTIELQLDTKANIRKERIIQIDSGA